MKYFNDENIKNFEFDQLPKNVGDIIIEGKLEQIDIRIYMKMFRMTKITLFKNDKGDRYIKFAYKTMMAEFDIKSKTTISNSIKRLNKLGLLHIETKLGYASKYFLVCGTEICNTQSQQTVQGGGVSEVDSNLYSNSIKKYNNNIYYIFNTIVKKFKIELNKDDIEKTVTLFTSKRVWDAINNLKSIKSIDDIKNYLKPKDIRGAKNAEEVILQQSKTVLNCEILNPKEQFLKDNNVDKYEELSEDKKTIYNRFFVNTIFSKGVDLSAVNY